MSAPDYNKILSDIMSVRYELKDLEGKITDLEKDIRAELNYKDKEAELIHSTYDRRISLTEKVVFGAVTIVLVTVMGAMLAKVII